MTRAAHPLNTLRGALRALHKALLDAERRDYERSFGRIGSDFYLLQLAAEDPQFAWLRALSGLMLDVDSLNASDGQVSATEMRLLATRIRALLLPTERPTPFQHRYQRAMQEDPAIVMAHSGVMGLLPPATAVRVFKSQPPSDIRDYGEMRVRMHYPGELVPGHGDRGYGPLALMAESFLPPGTVVPMHEHRNDEIISWVPDGTMHHEDLMHGKLPVDAGHLLVMNAGRAVSHSERTMATEPALRMLQLFIRPHAVDLDPRIQYGALPEAPDNAWRLLAGPEKEVDASPFTIRNDVELHDLRLAAGERVSLPHRHAWDAWLFVFSGDVELDGVPLGQADHALVQATRIVSLRAIDDAQLVLLLARPAATIVRAGTIGR